MKVIVKGKNKYEPTNEIRDYAERKLAKMDVYFRIPEEITGTVLCKQYDSYNEVEITIPTKNLILRAEVKSETFNSAIDLAIDKLESQMRKHKSKLYSSIKRRDGVSGYYAANDDFDLEQMKTELIVTNLVKSKKVDLKPMTADDAVVQMEMLGHSFYVFQNIESNKVCVVYLRDDHDYGIIETSL